MILLTKIFQTLLGVGSLILVAIIALGRLGGRKMRIWWKNRSKWFRRLIIGTIIFIPVSVMALVGYALYEDAYGRDYWDRTISNNIVLHSFANNTYKVYNKKTEEYTTDKINWVSEVHENDSLAVYAISHKRGYINVNTGLIIIDAKANNYKKAWVFSNGVAAVMKDGKIGFINAKNEVVIPFKFDFSSKYRRHDFGYIFYDGYCVMPNSKGDLGLIDKNGNWILEPAYDDIWAPQENGYRVIVKNTEYGIIDSTGAIVYPAEYGFVKIIPNGFVLTKGGKQWQVDFDGNIVQPFMFDSTYYLKYPIGYNEYNEIEYAFADFLKYKIINRYGIMNRITGEPITPAIYSDINMLSKDLFEVQQYKSNDWYLIDIKRNKVTKK